MSDEWQRLAETRKIAEYWIARCSRAEKQLEQHKWVSVKDRLPKPYEKVLIFTKGGSTDIDSFECMMSWGEARFYNYGYGVTHWMPLPSIEGLYDENT